MSTRPRAAATILLTSTTTLALACGPGGFATDGGFGEAGTADTGDAATVDSGPDSGPSTMSTSGPDTGPDTADTGPDTADTGPDTGPDTDTDTGNDDWVDPEDTETDTGEPDPPTEPPQCQRIWTFSDLSATHGHIGATPIDHRPDGGFVSVNPVIEGGESDVNVDAWFRSWSPAGELDWGVLLSWDELRDDPLALTHDSLGDIYWAGRTNANTQLENAMVAALDGDSGAVVWSYFRHAGGGYSSIVHNGAAIVAAGSIGDDAGALELVAFGPDTGQILWEASPVLLADDVKVRGMQMRDGTIDVLVTRIFDWEQHLSLIRFAPPMQEPVLTTTIASAPLPVEGPESFLDPQDLEYAVLGEIAVALYTHGEESFMGILLRSDGHLIGIQALADYGLGPRVRATELVTTPEGLAIGGSMWTDDDDDARSFIMRLDEDFEPICVGVAGKDNLPGIGNSLQLRGMVPGGGGQLITGSFHYFPRISVFARWN